AFATPASVSLIASLYPPGQRATPTSIYSSGIYVGGALASLSVLFSRLLGWRNAALLAGFSALPPALLLSLTPNPPPRPDSPSPPSASSSRPSPSSASSSPSLRSSLSTVLSVPSVRLLLAASAARFFAGFAIGAWTAPFYRTYFPNMAGSFAVANALIVACAGSLSVITGGWLSDELEARGRAHRVAYVPACGSLLAIPCWVVAMQAPSFHASMGGLCLAYLFAECWYQ
ncbi:MAG: hypothetical protein SGPRY_007818, partial [Prymnesium sp.]